MYKEIKWWSILICLSQVGSLTHQIELRFQFGPLFLCKIEEKLCLQWNDFQDNVKTAFGHLRDTTDFVDVTLASEDGQQIEAHKVILAASSPFFEKIFKENKHSHPLIYLKGMKTDDLTAIVDFLYFGEANVYQENFESFLAIAEELQLKGLEGSKTNKNQRRQSHWNARKNTRQAPCDQVPNHNKLRQKQHTNTIIQGAMRYQLCPKLQYFLQIYKS